MRGFADVVFRLLQCTTSDGGSLCQTIKSEAVELDANANLGPRSDRDADVQIHRAKAVDLIFYGTIGSLQAPSSTIFHSWAALGVPVNRFYLLI